MRSSPVCLSGCIDALCGYGSCCDCDTCTVDCVTCEYPEKVRGCDGDCNAGVGAGGDVVAVKYVI